MNTTKWIDLSQERIAPPVRPKEAQWALEIPSVYDVPSQMRASYDASSGFIKIEFKYLESEPTEILTIGEYLNASIGKKSRRIWAVEFDIHNFNRDRKRIVQVAEASIKKLSKVRPGNQEIASRAIHQNGESLFRFSEKNEVCRQQHTV